MVAYKAAQVCSCSHWHILHCHVMSDTLFFSFYLEEQCFSCVLDSLFSDFCLVIMCRILPWLNWHLPIPLGLVLHLTSQCSIMRF
jgi:hypothetical protein